MDAFEQLVSEILWNEGYWVRTSVKVKLSPGEKKQINRPTSPRWELDIVGYKGSTNELFVVECKSYLNSRGVLLGGFDGSDRRAAERFKLFNDRQLREVVFERLAQQLSESACSPSPNIKLCLACGRIAKEKDRAGIQEHFQRNGWILWDERWIVERLHDMSKGGYENQVAALTAKLLLRGKIPDPAE
jgi:hypothetical protein